MFMGEGWIEIILTNVGMYLHLSWSLQAPFADSGKNEVFLMM